MKPPTEKDHRRAMRNYRLVDAIMRVLQWLYTAKAQLFHKGYDCAALAGQSTYNVGIGADMSVNCNGQDRANEGVIGNLNQNTFLEIWTGAKAQAFRWKLANGKLPIHWCSRCHELKTVSRSEALSKVFEFQTPKHFMVENTSVCALECTACVRSVYDRSRQTKWISVPQFENIALLFKELGVKTCSFLRLGEPFLSRKINDEVSTLLKHNPDLKIATSTTGAALNSPDKMEAALKMKLVCFSIDGINTEMCRRYQKGQDFDKAFQAMKELVRLRDERKQVFPVVIWKWVVFRWNDKNEDLIKACNMCRYAGVDYFMVTPTFNPVGAWSWRYKYRPPMKDLRYWSPNIGGWLHRTNARKEQDDYIATM